MEAQYRNQLPAAVLPLVDEIEEAAGCEIVVRHDPAIDTPQCVRVEPIDGRYRPVLLFRESLAACDGPEGPYKEPYSMATHELLHLQRYFVERVPVMNWRGLNFRTSDGSAGEPGSNGFMFTAAGPENLLEHLVIEQRMPRYGFTPDYRWIRTWWSGPPFKLQAPNIRRIGYLHMWLETRYQYPTIGARKRAENVLEAEGLVRAAEMLFDSMARTIGQPGALYVAEAADRQKECMAMLYVKACGLPWQNVRFVYYMRDGSRQVHPFSPVSAFIGPNGKECRLTLTDPDGSPAHWLTRVVRQEPRP